MVIWYLNHYATPKPFGSPGRPYALAKYLARLGHEVVIFAASDHHLRSEPAPSEEWNTIKQYDGVSYFHLPSRSYSGNGLQRILNMLDYSRAIKKLCAHVNNGRLSKPDILIPSCVHPLSFPPAHYLAKKFSAKLVYEVRDIWPLSLVELTGMSRWHPLVLWMSVIERRAYRLSDAVVSLLPNALQHMTTKGLSPSKFNCIPNGVDVEEWESKTEQVTEEYASFVKRVKLEGKKIVIYAGSHGAPNALDQILNLKYVLGDNAPPYHFVLIGDGSLKSSLIKRANRENIGFVSFFPKVSKAQAMEAIKLADFCFVAAQKSKIYRFGVSPNKIVDYLMAGKPVINAIEAGNDTVQEANAGITVKPYNSELLDAALRSLCAASDKDIEILGQNGQEYVRNTLNWETLAGKYSCLFDSLH